MNLYSKLELIFNSVNLENLAQNGISQNELETLKNKVLAKFPPEKSQKMNEQLPIFQTNTEIINIFTDGASLGNPGPGGIGIFVESEGKELFSLAEPIGITTNNVAEYTALLRACEVLVKTTLKDKIFHFYLDSELVVKQINGLYKIKNEELKIINQKIRNELSKLKDWEIFHVRRELNKEADRLSKQGAKQNA